MRVCTRDPGLAGKDSLSGLGGSEGTTRTTTLGGHVEPLTLDVMAGLGSNDTCEVDGQADVVTAVAGDGTDLVISTAVLFTLPADPERYGKILGHLIPRAVWREQPRR